MAEQTARRRRPRRKTIILGVLALGAAAAFGATTQTWFVFTLKTPVAGGDTVTVAGTAATSAMTALSLAALAAAAAMAIAGRVARAVLAGLGVLLGAGVVTVTMQVLADPIHAGSTPISTKTGITGTHSVVALVGRTDTFFWPFLALAAGVLLALASIAVLVDGHRWPAPSKKYGETEGDTRRAFPNESEITDADERARRGDVAVDHWDRLSRGEDPTQM